MGTRPHYQTLPQLKAWKMCYFQGKIGPGPPTNFPPSVGSQTKVSKCHAACRNVDRRPYPMRRGADCIIPLTSATSFSRGTVHVSFHGYSLA